MRAYNKIPSAPPSLASDIGIETSRQSSGRCQVGYCNGNCFTYVLDRATITAGVVSSFSQDERAEDHSHTRGFAGADSAAGFCNRRGQRLASFRFHE
jgi:hypothetical protein